MFPNITQTILLQAAFQVVLNSLSSEIETHTTCVITSNDFDGSFYVETPNFRLDCDEKVQEFDLNSNFVQKLMFGINNGCAYFLVSQSCVPQFLEVFFKTHFYSMSKFRNKVLVIIGNGQNNDILNEKVIVEEIPLTLLLQPRKIDEITEKSSIDVYSAFPSSQRGQIRNSFFIKNNSFAFQTRFFPKILDLEGMRIDAGFIHLPPFSSGEVVAPGKGNAHTYGSNELWSMQLGGQEGTIMVEFCKKFNCNLYARFDYHDSLWGEIYPNLTGRGMLGDMALHEIELAVGSFYLVHGRFKTAQYSYVVQLSFVTHALPKPKPLAYWYIPILPFSPIVWVCFVASLFIATNAILFLDKGRIQMLPNSKIKPESGVNAFINVYRISMSQNVLVRSNVGSSLIMYSIFMIFCLTLNSFYIGGLSSLMAVLPTEGPIDTIAKLVQSNLEWGTTSDTFLLPVIQSTDPAFVRYAKNFKVHAVEDFHKLVKQQRAAVIVETMQGGTLCYQQYIDRNDSKFLMVQKEPLYTAYTGIIASKTWPYMEQLNRIVMMQAESGIGAYWEHKSAEQSMDYEIQRNIIANTKNKGSREPVKLSVSHILGPLFILLFGNLFGFVAFLIEIFWGKDKKFVKTFKRKVTAVIYVLRAEQ
ncbi:uncharacterized protein LOC134832305 [Culicoides brevitarsis]|uniref:uncharacterized protein LOC134832305 n=1 Tax=Culicoides brevitarsis TaxID=469753 RepID=UPI00307C008F